MLTLEELESALSVGYEARGFEFKGSGATGDKHFLAKVARAALSMGNLRDGGYIVVGIDDARPQDMRPGLAEAVRDAWLAYDEVSARLAPYCDPPLSFEVASFDVSSGACVVVIQVHEFEEIPHLCARDYPDVMRRGALYVRCRRMPETAEVASSVEMREVLDLAAEKRLRAYVETAERAGARLTSRDTAAAADEDESRFESQLDEAWGE